MNAHSATAIQGRAPHVAAAREACGASDACLVYARAELNHRVKNSLATALSLATQTGRHAQTVPEFMAAFSGRIQALSKAYEFMARADWRPVALRDLLELAVGRFVADAGRFELHGEPAGLEVEARAAVSLLLVLHELATNAAEYGGLSAGGRGLSVSWALNGHVGELTWQERCDQEAAPERAGAGLLLIERLIRGDLGGDSSIRFLSGGVLARLTFDVNGATA